MTFSAQASADRRQVGRVGIASIAGSPAPLHRSAGAALLAGMAAHSFMPLGRVGTAAVGLIFAASAHRLAGRCLEAVRKRSPTHSWRIFAILAVKFGSAIGLAALRRARPLGAFVGRVTNAGVGDTWRESGALVPALLRELPVWSGRLQSGLPVGWPHPWRADECAHAATVHLGGTLHEVAAGERAVNSTHPRAPFVLVANLTRWVRRLAVGGDVFQHGDHGAGRHAGTALGV
ncbi:putative fAD dependent oxidoreductase [Mycobacterium xenopi 3993]|nr:putative fAD dependent oxidoreductase [Mycobacterium xenopi 3993]